MKTYSNKSNAKRAAINFLSKELNLDKEYIKSNEDKYFTIGSNDAGFYIEYINHQEVESQELSIPQEAVEEVVQQEMELPQDLAPAPVPATTKGIKIEKEREERNGIIMPSVGTRCREVWDKCQQVYDEQGVLITPKIMKDIALGMGWNQNNSIIEMYQWRRFNGIIGRQKVNKGE